MTQELDLTNLRKRAELPNALHGCSSDPCGSVVCQTARDRDELLTRLEQAEQAVEKSKRACEALGRVIEIDGANLVKLTDSQELVDADGDGDWEEIWGIAFDLKDRATKAEQALARVREALSGHPRTCDQHTEDDPVKCGWKRAVIDVQSALDGETRG